MPQPLRLRICLDERELIGAAAGELEIPQGFGVDREDRGGGAVLGAHVADGCPVRERDGADPFAEELHELSDHTMLAQHLGDGEHEVGGGRACR